MVKSVKGTKCYQTAMKNAMAIASFMIAVPGASLAKNAQIKENFDVTAKSATSKKLKESVSNEASSVDKISKSKSSSPKPAPDKKVKNQSQNTKQTSTKVATKENVKPAALPNKDDKINEEVATIFTKPFFTKVSKQGFEVEKVSTSQMALELGLDPIGNINSSAGGISNKAPWQKIGSPYKVNGMWYIPAAQSDYDEVGVASWYGPQFHGKKTANGEVFDMNEISIAHPTLPIPCLVEVTNLENGRSIIARVNDRGPFADDRIIDASAKAAELLGFKNKGTAKVRVKYVGVAPEKDIKPNYLNTKLPVLPDVIKNQKQANTGSLINGLSLSQDGMTQIGSFSDPKLARKYADQQPKSLTTKIVEAEVGGKLFYRVYVSNEAQAVSPSKKIKDHNSILASL